MNKCLQPKRIFVNPRLRIKRHMSIAIVICLLLALFVPVRAEAYTDSDFTFSALTISREGEIVGSGDIIEIQFRITSPYTINNVSAMFNGDSVITIDMNNVEDSDIYKGEITLTKSLKEGAYYLSYLDVRGKIDGEDFYYGRGYNDEKYGFGEHYFFYSDECKSTNTHLFDSGEITKYPTSTEPGEKIYTCERCGYKSIETIPIDNQTNIENSNTDSVKDDNSVSLV